MRRTHTWRYLALASFALLAAPASAEEDRIESGRQLYQRYCASCHAIDGRGGTPLAKLFRKEPPDLTRIAARRGVWYPEALVKEIVDGRHAAHGDREMPVWGAALPADEIARIAEYLNTIQRMAVAP
jgi:mono/diheme cytochrome c family protein